MSCMTRMNMCTELVAIIGDGHNFEKKVLQQISGAHCLRDGPRSRIVIIYVAAVILFRKEL